MSNVEGSGYYKEDVNLRAENEELRARLERAEEALLKAQRDLARLVADPGHAGTTLAIERVEKCLREYFRLGAAGERGQDA